MNIRIFAATHPCSCTASAARRVCVRCVSHDRRTVPHGSSASRISRRSSADGSRGYLPLKEKSDRRKTGHLAVDPPKHKNHSPIHSTAGTSSGPNRRPGWPSRIRRALRYHDAFPAQTRPRLLRESPALSVNLRFSRRSRDSSSRSGVVRPPSPLPSCLDPLA